MPRRRTLPQDCIVCESDPCTCNKKPDRPKRPPRQRQPEPEQPHEPVAVALKPSAVDAMRRAAQSAELDRRKVEPLAVKSKTDLGDADALTVEALRTLGEPFTVEGEDVDKYQRYLKREATPGERAAAWRARRRE